MKNEDQHVHPGFTITILLLLVLLGIVLFRNQRASYNQQLLTPTVLPTREPTFFNISDLKQGQSYLVGQSLTLQINGFSNNHEVVGYDTLVRYDPTAFDFVQSVGADPKFTVVATTRENHVSVTGVKNPTNNDQTVFNNNPVVSLTFTAKKKGSFKFALMPTIGLETTKLINSNTKVFLPYVNTLDVVVK